MNLPIEIWRIVANYIVYNYKCDRDIKTLLSFRSANKDFYNLVCENIDIVKILNFAKNLRKNLPTNERNSDLSTTRYESNSVAFLKRYEMIGGKRIDSLRIYNDRGIFVKIIEEHDRVTISRWHIK